MMKKRIIGWAAGYWRTFSFVGLIFATFFFAGSVTPSLIPRPYLVQGILSGFALAIGYGVGICTYWMWRFLELPVPTNHVQVWAKRLTVVLAALVFGSFLWHAAFWQNSIRELMKMPPVESAYPMRFFAIAVPLAMLLIALVRLKIRFGSAISRRLNRYMPRRIAYAVSTLVVAITVIFLLNGVIARGLVNAADRFFAQWDRLNDPGIDQPQEILVAGSSESQIRWSTIGRLGKSFIVGGPTSEQLSDFCGVETKKPVRVYVGLRSRPTRRERAKLALEELKRVGGFERSLLVVATPTGTGWLDPSAVDTLEYLHRGDTAIVSMQYSYLPSWITILVDPNRSKDSARVLFDEIYSYWTTLPKDDRPRLYLHGLSLGSLGSELSADLYTTLEDPIDGAVWSGPPFPSTQWAMATASRNPDSPQWLPEFRDSALLRFTAQQNSLNSGLRWGPIRSVYIQYASDPMVFFSPDILLHRPEWLYEERGPDVSPHLRWYPIITCLQIAFDLPMATSVPIGFGHNYSPSSYIDAWAAVTEPSNWSDEKKELLVKRLESASSDDEND